MNGEPEQWMIAALEWLISAENSSLPPQLAESMGSADPAELDAFAEQLGDRWDEAEVTDPSQQPENYGSGSEQAEAEDAKRRSLRLRVLLQLIAARVLRLRLSQTDGNVLAAVVRPETLAQMAIELAGVDLTAAAHCLQILAAQADESSLEVLTDLIKRDLLNDDHALAVALSPLFQWPPPGLAGFFERIGDECWRVQLLGPLLDLAGHSFRKGRLRPHPFSARVDRLRELLGGTVQRLSRLEENPQQFGDDVATIQNVLSNAVALTVSLCDALALVGDQAAEGKLQQAMELSHRRVQTEAACALARMGFPAGKERLLQLTADPMARSRAVAYADELGMEEDVPAEWRSNRSMAESDLVMWLADRERFGLPPSEMELIDERVQYWPSYEQPQECFLWKFTYRFGENSLSNIAIAGPLVYAVRADLKAMAIDDIYSLYAGWQAEHEDIYEIARPQFNSAQLQEAERLMRYLEDQDIEQLEAMALTFFFGERAVLAQGVREEQTVCCIADGLESLVVPVSKRATSLTPDLVLALYRGRKLLRTFN